MFRTRRPPPARESKPPRILFVGTLPEPTTGQSLACQVLLEDLRSKYDVTVVDLVKSTLSKGVGSAIRVVEVLKIVLRTARGARHADVVYITIAESVLGNLRDLLLYVASIGKLKATVIHLHGGAGMRDLMSDRHRLLKRVNAVFLRRLGGVIVLGERHLSMFEPYVDQARLVVVPNFALNELFVEERDILAKFANVEPLRVLFLSNLIAGKGWIELLAAYEQLSPSMRESIELDFAGAIAEDDERGHFLERLDRLPRARYHGAVRGDTKASLLAEAHVFCLPTFYAFEGQPISILEAYASGCVVVTTDHSGIFDVFEPGLNGVEVEPKSIESLRSALTELLGRMDLSQIALHNRRQAWAQFRSEEYCANVGRVIEMVLKPQDGATR